MSKILQNFLDFIWPQFCLGCKTEGALCCGFCLNDILLQENNKISWPDKDKLYFEACYVCCDYHNKLLQKIIKNYKYSYLENMADLLVDILEKQSRRLSLPKNTIISNVPLHKRKRKIRGFDQTEILAKKLAQRLNLKYSPMLVRKRHTKAQARLSKEQRQKNISNAFEINKKDSLKNSKSPKKILLLDDVTTTGSTLNQASKALKEAGYKNIFCLAIAKN
ncbi:hypothetical protein C0580_01545 [Candidatus Parcubacteria bacterium]|nr:MAG: hypothetical protein C0580_01545 [Candidatus Parcubacteria bacterium]